MLFLVRAHRSVHLRLAPSLRPSTPSKRLAWDPCPVPFRVPVAIGRSTPSKRPLLPLGPVPRPSGVRSAGCSRT